MNKEYKQIVREKFPNLQYSEFRVLDNQQERLAIDDLSYKNPLLRSLYQKLAETLTLSCRGFINVLGAEELSVSFNNQLEELLARLNPKRSVLIFPGNGAKAVKDLLPKTVPDYFTCISLETCRQLAPDMSVDRVEVLTSRSSVQKLLPPKLTTCVIIDDVFASGSTAQTVRKFFDQGSAFEWFAGGWMSLSPLQAKDRKKPDDYQSSLPGFQRLITSIVYQGITGIPANNSLSSFAENDKKSELVIEGYRRRYVEDVDTFNKTILELRILNG